jgi:N-acetyl-anhydromuramyl-L-alanine amidase AmpD
MSDCIYSFSRFTSWRVVILPLAIILNGCASGAHVKVASENFNSRVSLIVIHFTTADFGDSLRILTKRSANPVSSHYLIPEPDDATYPKGELRVHELVPETSRAWHAGDSYWGGRISLNDQSIGIELVNRSYCHNTNSSIAIDTAADGSRDEAGAILEAATSLCFYPDFSDAQLELLIGLLDEIHERHPSINSTHIVGHADIAPDRKVDPGPRFPWQRLYRLGYGAWYEDEAVIRYWEQFRILPMPLCNVQKALKAYGYGIEPTGMFDEQTRNVLRAFQMHFRPWETTGEATSETVAVLYALIERYYPEQLDDLLQIDPLPQQSSLLTDGCHGS